MGCFDPYNDRSGYWLERRCQWLFRTGRNVCIYGPISHKMPVPGDPGTDWSCDPSSMIRIGAITDRFAERLHLTSKAPASTNENSACISIRGLLLPWFHLRGPGLLCTASLASKSWALGSLHL